MKLILDKDFHIEGDKNSFALHYKRLSGKINAKGNESFSRDDWYYSNIKDCLEAYLSRAVGSLGVTSAEEILAKYEEILSKLGEIKEFIWAKNERGNKIINVKQTV